MAKMREGRPVPVAEPGRILIVGCDSGWRQWEPAEPPGYAGDLIVPNGPLAAYDPQDMGVTDYGVRVYSIRWPR